MTSVPLHLLTVLFLSLCVNAPVGVCSHKVKRQSSSGSYPTYRSVPETSFSCDQYGPGYYADPETGCQAFHVCHADTVDSFLCPTGSIFNQKVFVCDWWYNVDCDTSAQFFYLNSLIGRPEAAAGRSDAAPDVADAAALGTPREAAQEPTPAIGSQSRTSFSRRRPDYRAENAVFDGRASEKPNQRAGQAGTEGEGLGIGDGSAVVSIGQDVYSGFSPSAARGFPASDEDGVYTADDAIPEASSGGRKKEISRRGRVLDNALGNSETIAEKYPTESPVESRPASPSSSNSQSSQRIPLNSVTSNSVKTNTFPKTEAALKPFLFATSSPSDTAGPSHPEEKSKPTSSIASRPISGRPLPPAPFTAFQRSTPRPFRPTIPRVSRPSSGNTYQPTVSPRPLKPVSSKPSRHVTLKPFRRVIPEPFSSVTSEPLKPVSAGAFVAPTPRPVQPTNPRPSGFSIRRRIPTLPDHANPEQSILQPNPSKPFNRQPPVVKPTTLVPASRRPTTSKPTGRRLSQPQYRLDEVRADLQRHLDGVELVDVPADRMAPGPQPVAGGLVFSERGQSQPDWLYALGGLVF